MKVDLDSLLPDNISDECAYHLVNFFSELACALDSRYLAQMKRYVNDNDIPHLPSYLQDKSHKNNSF